MGLRQRHDKHGEIPGTSQPASCSHQCDGVNKCGKEAHTVLEAKVEVMGKMINVKKMICHDCAVELGVEAKQEHYSIGESNA